MFKDETSNKERALAHLRELGGLAQLREFQSINISPTTLRRLLADNKVYNPGRGVYVLPGCAGDPMIDYAVEAISVPQTSCISMLSAAYLHELVARDPREFWITIPRGAWAPCSAGRLPVHAIQSRLLSVDGLMERPPEKFFPTCEMSMAGRAFTATSPAKTVADLFAYRSRFGIETAVEALGSYMARGDTISEIEAFARQLGVGDIIRPYLAGAGVSMNRRY